MSPEYISDLVKIKTFAYDFSGERKVDEHCKVWAEVL